MAKIIVLGTHAETFMRFRYDMLRAMALQHEVLACAPQGTERITSELEQIGVKFQEVNLSRTGLNPFRDLLSVVELTRIFKKFNADQILAYNNKAVIYGSLAARIVGIKQVYSMITGLGTYYTQDDFKSRIVRKIMSKLYKYALHFNQTVFFQNPDDKAEFLRLGVISDKHNCLFINGSGVNLNHFNVLDFKNQRLTFLMIGRLLVTKGVREYLMAARELKQQYPQVEFLLLGDIEAHKADAISLSELQAYIDDGTVEYLGVLDDVRPAFARASVFVLPSYREGTPKSVLEAMACGRPIITTDAPGCRETVINGENGFLVPVKDVKALRGAMESFVRQPDLISKMGSFSRQLAQKKYDVQNVNRIILQAMGH